MMDDNMKEWFMVPQTFSSNPLSDHADGMNKVEDIEVSIDNGRTNENSPNESDSSSSVSVVEEGEVTDMRAYLYDCCKHDMTPSFTISQLPNLVTNTPSRGTKHLRSQFISNRRTSKHSRKLNRIHPAHLKIDKNARKLNALQLQTVDASTSTDLQDIFIPNSLSTFDQRKIDGNTDECSTTQTVKKLDTNHRFQSKLRKKRQNSSWDDVFHMALTFSFAFLILIVHGVLYGEQRRMEVENLNKTIIMLKQDNLLLRKQMLYNAKNENRKLTSITRFIFSKLEEKENASRNFENQLNHEAFYQKEIDQLKEQVSFLQADCKIVQSLFKTIDSIVEGENVELINITSTNETYDKEKSKSYGHVITKEKVHFHQDTFNKSTSDEMQNRNISHEKLNDLLTLLNQKLNLTKIETKPKQGFFESFVKSAFDSVMSFSNAYNISTVFSSYSEALTIFRNNIHKKNISTEALTVFRNYIHKKNISTRLSGYLSNFKSMGCKTYHSVTLFPVFVILFLLLFFLFCILLVLSRTTKGSK